MSIHRTTSGLLLAAALSAGLLAGCSSDGSDASPSTTAAPTTTVASTTSAPGSTTAPATTAADLPASTTATTAAPQQACTSGAPAIPSGAVQKPIVDVDGDGKADVGFIHDAGGTVTVGIVTAAGGGATAAFDSASPVTRTMLVANADERGPAEIFLDDGRLVQLDAFVGCKIVPVTNPQGQPYEFGLGFTDVGTGVGCIDTPGGRRLAGLDIDQKTSTDTTVHWTSTVVELDGAKAKNGKTTKGTYARPADDAKVQLLSSVTCGTLTAATDGITLEG
ncbi:hypothetical protein KSP35_22930 [Aquihabitans sp. G128]|uniref:hypothetical protein n=1 Tax=Aquihabitans sp. G128 TaxID=2849779 RepID=UPI001C246705|nr:hypothetical protein [Aquihabitans sp. G128]QXC61129.1 hypothetical protein KSP35_22930 [Aquihabitans sp. G128]